MGRLTMMTAQPQAVRLRRRACLLLVLCALLPFVANAAEPVMTYAFHPSEQHTKALSQIACEEPHGVSAERIRAVTYKKDDVEQASVAVVCKSHDLFRDEPARYSVDCKRTDGEWDCYEEALEILVGVGSRTLTVRPGRFDKEFAYDTVKSFAAAGNFQGVPLAEAMRSPCALSQAEKGELFQIECSGVLIIASRWCPQGGCPRIISVSRGF